MKHNQLYLWEYSLFPTIVDPVHLGDNLTEFSGFQRLVMLDRYSLRDNTLQTLKVGDVVVCTLKDDPKYPTMGFGRVTNIDGSWVDVQIEYPEYLEGLDLPYFRCHRDNVIKPLELYWEQIAYRVAKAIARVEGTEEKRNYWFDRFYWMMKNLYAVPGGRILYGAGNGSDTTLFNCFVLPPICDSRQGIIKHIGLATEIMSRGGGVGSNISTLRPRKTTVKGVNGYSSGSVSWANYLSSLTHLIIQGGSRRGAQMICLADWHPDVVEFILCKMQNPHVLDKIIKEIDDEYIRSRAEYYLVRDAQGNPVEVKDKNFMTGANISVLVSNDFMKAVENDDYWDLRFPDIDVFTSDDKITYDRFWHEIADVRKWESMGGPVKTYHTLKASALWDLINICARYSAEPGVIFIDEVNQKSNSWYYASLISTNPCGEQPLPPWGVCNLIAINLERMYDSEKHDVNWDLLKEVVWVSQRFADNVVDASSYFFAENETMAKSERRVGKGVMGLADLMIYLKLPYGSDEMLEKTDKIFEFIAVESYLASCALAEEKGSFPKFDKEEYLKSGYVQNLPEYVRKEISKKGIRNVCSLTVAPTGSIGSMVGVSTGIEPYFAFKYYRSGRLGKSIEINTSIAQRYFAEHPDAEKLPDYYVSAQDLSPLEHVRVQAVVQRWVDSSISKTCNAPSTFTVEDNKELYMTAWKLGCKGITVYVDGTRDTQVLSVKADNEKDVEEVKENKEEEVYNAQDSTSSEDMTTDTRVCRIYVDSSGSLVRECS